MDNELPLFETSREPKARDEKPGMGQENEFSKFIVYVDESGDHSMTTINEHYPVFVLAFCVFYKEHYSEAVVPSLEKFKFKHFGHDQIILHEAEIRKQTAPFNIFKNRSHKTQFLEELTTIIEDNNFILISCVIDKKHLKQQDQEPENPYHIALKHCLESLHSFLKEKGDEKKMTHIIFEQRGKNEDRDLELEFRRLYDSGQAKGMNFQMMFSNKKAMSSGLQLADLVARPIGLSQFRPEQNNRAFEVLKTKFYCKGGRAKIGQEYEQWGLKIHPPKKATLIKAKSPQESPESTDAD